MLRLAIGASLAATLLGCGGPAPVTPEEFYARRQGPADAPRQPYDRSGTLQFEQVEPAVAPAPTPRGNEPNTTLSETVTQGIQNPDQSAGGPIHGGATTAPTTAPPLPPPSASATTNPASQPMADVPYGVGAPSAIGTPTTQSTVSGEVDAASNAGAASSSGAVSSSGGSDSGATSQPMLQPSGQYMILGSVVAEVNGTPIYANKVLSLLQPNLQADAKQYDIDRYRIAARDLIEKQVQELVRSELEFAAASRNLDAQARSIADSLTTQWRQRKVSEAGGSIELARRKAAADGQDFDEMLQDQYRLFMTRIYYQKKIIPQIQVTPTMMRAYYQEHLNDLFSQHASATFLLIKIDPEATGSKEDALAKIQSIRQRAEAGEDFADLAGKLNDDPGLMEQHGKVTIDRGTFVLDDVEDAVFALQPGQLTDIIYTHDAYYLAKLISKTDGKVQPFSSEAVQDKISGALRAEQFRALREQEQRTLLAEAIVRVDPDMMEAALDMAMQNYPVWAKN